MPRSAEFHIGPGRYSGGRRPIYVGSVGDPSAPASSTASIPRGLAGALDPDCDDELFDCPGKEMEEEEEMAESLIREFVRGILLMEKEEVIDEDELPEEEENEVDEINAI